MKPGDSLLCSGKEAFLKKSLVCDFDVECTNMWRGGFNDDQPLQVRHLEKVEKFRGGH